MLNVWQTVKLQRDQERSKAFEKKLATTGPPKDTTILPHESERVNKKLIVDPSEKDSDLLLERMNNKLNFMRNPRHDKNKYGGKAGGGANGLGNKVGDVSTAVLITTVPYKGNGIYSRSHKKKFNLRIMKLGKNTRRQLHLEMLRLLVDAYDYLPPRSEHFTMALYVNSWRWWPCCSWNVCTLNSTFLT